MADVPDLAMALMFDISSSFVIPIPESGTVNLFFFSSIWILISRGESLTIRINIFNHSFFKN